MAHRSRWNPHKIYFLVAALVFLSVFIVLLFYTPTSPLCAYVVAISLAAFVMMGIDKRLASLGGVRVPELVLLLCSLIGGSVGILCGAQFFRHKTRKGSFQVIVVLITLGQLVLLWWLFKQ